MTITIPTIAALPTAPSRTDPATFATRGDAFVAALATLRSEINTTTAAIKTQVEAEVTGLAPLASPVFTGNPTAPTQTPGTNNTRIATTAYADASASAAASAAVAGGKAGDWMLIKSTTVSSPVATVDFVHGSGGVVIDSTYDEYQVVFLAVAVSTDNSQLYMRTTTNAGGAWDASASDYHYSLAILTSAGNTANAATAAATEIAIASSFPGAIGNASGENGLYGRLFFHRPSSAQQLVLQWDVAYREASGGSLAMVRGSGMRNAASDVDGIRFLVSGGTNIASGVINLYGRKK